MAGEDMNEVFTVNFADSEVITVPIDDTLSNTGEAADAKAVGDALALKADKDDIHVDIDVNGQSADAQGHIELYPNHIPMSASDPTTVKDALDTLDSELGTLGTAVAGIGNAVRAAINEGMKSETVEGEEADDEVFDVYLSEIEAKNA